MFCRYQSLFSWIYFVTTFWTKVVQFIIINWLIRKKSANGSYGSSEERNSWWYRKILSCKHFDKTIENHMRDGSLGKSNEVDIYNF